MANSNKGKTDLIFFGAVLVQFGLVLDSFHFHLILMRLCFDTSKERIYANKWMNLIKRQLIDFAWAHKIHTKQKIWYKLPIIADEMNYRHSSHDTMYTFAREVITQW